MAQAIAAPAAVVFSSKMGHQDTTTDTIGYCKRCGQDYFSTEFKCGECKAPTYWQCGSCGKEVLLQNHSEHAKTCSEDKHKKSLSKASARGSKTRSKRSSSHEESPYMSEDSGSEFEHKRGKQHSSDEEYTASSASEDDCWSPESSPDSGHGKSYSRKNSPTSSNGYVAQVSALYNYVAMRKDDLSFKEGDIICVLNKRPSGWWLGELNGKVGLLPSNYVKEVLVETRKEKPSSGNGNNKSSHTSAPRQGGKSTTCKTIAEYEELMRLLKLELEQSQLRCRQQEDKIRLMEKERSDSLKELTYIKAVLESSLNYKQEEDVEALEALHSLQSFLN